MVINQSLRSLASGLEKVCGLSIWQVSVQFTLLASHKAGNDDRYTYNLVLNPISAISETTFAVASSLGSKGKSRPKKKGKKRKEKKRQEKRKRKEKEGIYFQNKRILS